jgi:Beta protein
VYPIDNTFYCAALRGKAGEFIACSELNDPNKDRLLPYFILPSLTAKENEAFSIDDVIAEQVGKIWDHWGPRPCLLDPRFLQFDEDGGSDAARISQLLTHARAARCRVIPVVDLATNYYRTAAAGAHARNTRSGACLRVTFSDLFNVQLKQVINTQLSNLGIPSSDCLLALDFSDADLSATDAFAKFAIDWLVQLRGFGMWPRIILLATNYPRKNPAAENAEKTIPRAEWSVWKRILELDPTVKDYVMFGDYGADNAEIDFDACGRAITHLRYATATDWLVVRAEDDRVTIRSVMRRIVASSSFSGEIFSAGDEFIGSRARGVGRW